MADQSEGRTRQARQRAENILEEQVSLVMTRTKENVTGGVEQ